MDSSLWIIFTLTYLGMTLSPGPNVVNVLTHATNYGFRSILVPISANLSCQLLIIVAVGLGSSALLKIDSAAYHWIKYAGGSYLVYLGFKTIYELFVKNRLKVIDQRFDIGSDKVIPSVWKRYAQSFIVSASNPKTVIFLSAFLPQFLVPGRTVFIQFAIMYLTISAIVASIHGVYAFMLIKMQDRMSSSLDSKLFPGLSGVIYIFLGIALVVSA